MLSPPSFHHLHLHSLDPEAAIGFYTRQFAGTRKGEWEGVPALFSPNDALILFTKTEKPPPLLPQSAIWHFGWHVKDSRACLETYKSRREVELLPLYTSEEGGSVFISSDAWPGAEGRLGRTRREIAEAKAQGIRPAGGPGFAYMKGPDGALVEYAGDHPALRFNHVHFFEEDPGSASDWYRRHLGAEAYGPFAGTVAVKRERKAEPSWPALAQQGMIREPRAGVRFGDVAFLIYPNQGREPLAASRGQLQDHIALAVEDLDAWVVKLKSEGVRFLEEPASLGRARAAMIAGPSREAIELIEV